MNKICAISDTHGYHDAAVIPDCDILVHAGDWSPDETTSSTVDFLRWLGKQKARHVVFTAGNHDWIAERNPGFFRGLVEEFCPNAHYLQDSGVEIEGLKFHGSPVTPEFCGWAFNRKRGADIKRHWDMIPDDVDALVTHGPSYQLLDLTDSKEHVGCIDLGDAVRRVKPLVHLFGHIHRAYGKGAVGCGGDNAWNTDCYNCSFVGENYYPQNKPHVFDL